LLVTLACKKALSLILLPFFASLSLSSRLFVYCLNRQQDTHSMQARRTKQRT
jgi:hypothetical protein